MPVSPHLLPPGHLLQNGSYRIVKVLGQGGFGITYEAENTGSKLVPRVAIKEFFMKGCVRGDGLSVASHSVAEGEFHRFRESFQKEAEMLERFRLKGIVEVRDLFEENNTAYMVMKFVEGKTLKQIVEAEGAISKEKAIDYLQQLCETLSVVHAQNAVHRDISPDNIILTPEGRTVLIDFGAAKQYMAEHTQSSVGLVKDGFSPREQYSLTSKKGPWSDVYALGALGHYLLLGKRPLPSIDRFDDPDWQPVTGHAEVDEVLTKAMAMQPAKRYQDARAMDAALRGESLLTPSGESDQTYKHTQKQPSDLPAKTKWNKPNSTSPKNGAILKDVSWLEMVLVEGGSFLMGSDNGDSDEKPVHPVELSSFYIGKTPVTQAQWRRVMVSNPPNLEFKGCNECPVEGVSWKDVQEFLQRLNEMTGQIFRLPTEAEWEYAAFGGILSRSYHYAGSNDLNKVAWYHSNSRGKTHPVAQKNPNELGLYDMTGNVWEWCADWYGKNYYASIPQKNPTGLSVGDYRVVRGGAWLSDDYDCRAAHRGWNDPDIPYNCFGFRLCRDL